MDIEKLKNYQPQNLFVENPTNKTRKPLIDVGEHLPVSDGKYSEIVRISLASTTGDVISIMAKRNSGDVRIKIVDEYSSKFTNYINKYQNIPTQGEVYNIIVNMINTDYPQPLIIEIIKSDPKNTIDKLTKFIHFDSNLYPALNDLFKSFLQEMGYK